MTTFETLATREITYGNRNFIEVARKVARDGRRTDGDGTEFLSLSRGYQTEDGQRRYKTNFTMPYQMEIVEFVRGALVEVSEPNVEPTTK